MGRGKRWYWKLHWQILIAMGLAIPYGLVLGAEGAEAVGWLGDLFLRLLKMVVVPLVLFSIVSGVTGVGTLKGVGRMGLKTVTYYVVTSTLAILIGLFMANLIHPGDESLRELAAPPQQEQSAEAAGQDATGLDATISGKDLLYRLVPENPVEDMVFSDDRERQPNILGIIFFAILFGVCVLAQPDERRDRIASLFDTLFGVMMKMTNLIIRTAPVGVFALTGRVVGETGLDAFGALGKYMLTVLFSLGIHAFVTLPLLCWFIARRNPWRYARALAPALATAFSGASSNAALPVTLQSVEKNANISNRYSSFVLPLGATINMDGTALYECVAVLFIAQCYGIDLGFGQQMIVVITALLASIGAAAIPHAGLVMMVIVLGAVGLPREGVGMILAVDRILDMCRTTVNVWSDSIGAATVARLEGEHHCETGTA